MNSGEGECHVYDAAHHTHNFHRFELDRNYGAIERKLKNLKLSSSKNSLAICWARAFTLQTFEPTDSLPARAVAEASNDRDCPADVQLLAMFVEGAVREVGWAPRDEYRYMSGATGMSVPNFT